MPYSRCSLPPTAEQVKNRLLWAADLRSGRYVQGRGYLRSAVPIDYTTDPPRHGMCCLAVAIERYASRANGAGWKGGGWQSSIANTYVGQSVPPEVADALGLQGGELSAAAYYNDGGPKCNPQDFPQIAEWIEKGMSLTILD